MSVVSSPLHRFIGNTRLLCVFAIHNKIEDNNPRRKRCYNAIT